VMIIIIIIIIYSRFSGHCSFRVMSIFVILMFFLAHGIMRSVLAT
jgi:hypothetical protein